jgi:hypothetical protein
MKTENSFFLVLLHVAPNLYNKLKTKAMKKNVVLLVFLLPLFFISCMTARTSFNRGYYDLAIEKSAHKLKKKPSNEKHIDILHKSYNIANRKDIDRIFFLRSSGEPHIWEEIFELYNRLKRRQEMVRFLDSKILERMNFQFVNYDNEIHTAKQNAAEFFYAKATQLLNENSRLAARQAYMDFVKVKQYYQNFRDTDQLIRQAEEKGTANILYQVRNATNLIMPEGFSNELTQLNLADMNVLFRRFYNKYSKNITFHYYVSLYIQDIITSPEQLKEIHYSETKEIQDGFQYVLDDKGNVMKDSLGNDIKVPKMVEIRCNIVEIQQFKAVTVRGTISIQNEQNQALINEPVTGEWVFDNRYISFTGDKRAMSEETRRKLSWKPMPFPATEYMILQTTDVLKNMSKDFVYKNRNMFQ